MDECKIAEKTTTGKLLVIAIASMISIVVLDLLLTPAAYVGLASVMFCSAILVVLLLMMKDVKKTCKQL